MQTERDDAHKDIARRLEELSRWQEEQKKLLHARQNKQREMLGIEHRNMYKMLGMLEPPPSPNESGAFKVSDVAIKEIKELERNNNIEQEEDRTPTTQRTSGYSTENGIVPSLKLPDGPEDPTGQSKLQKRPFLRRGEGLKQRFRINPDDLRLNNLPRYKYATKFSKQSQEQKQILKENDDNSKPIDKKIKNATTEGKKMETSSTAKACLSSPISVPSPLDAQEKRFQQLLFASHTTCNSTPDTKVQSSNALSKAIDKSEGATLMTPSSMDSELLVPISWATVLDAQQIHPIPVQKVRCAGTTTTTNRGDFKSPSSKTPDSLLDNLSVFELLEQKAMDGSFDINSPSIQKFMRRKLRDYHLQAEEQAEKIPVSQELMEARLQPLVCDVLPQESTTCTSTVSGIDNEDDDNDNDEEFYTTDDNDQDTNKEESPVIVTGKNGKPRYKVHFIADAEETKESEIIEPSNHIGNDSANWVETSSTLIETTSNYTASINSSEIFHQFKEALVAALSNPAQLGGKLDHTGTECPPPNATTTTSEMLEQKAELVRQRLVELESEIASFKENNAELMRARQEHELVKAHFTQERIEAMDRLNDERVKMEIELHDERMKIEDEKRRFEQKMRVARSQVSSTERKEVNRLKQELEDVQAQLKTKEQNHLAAQGRLRAKIRTMEKDQKHLLDDIESMRKQIKRLEDENMRFNRESSSKMLIEINRNIAKLAPKLGNCKDDDDNNHLRSRIAPKTTNQSATSRKKDIPRPGRPPPNKSVKQNTATSKSCMKTTRNKTPPHNSDKKHTLLSTCDSFESTDDDDDDNDVDNGDNNYDEDDDASFLSDQANDKAGNVLPRVNLIANDNKDTLNQNNNVMKAKQIADEKDLPILYFTKNTEDFRREIVNADGSKDIWYPNGNLKKITADGMNIRMLYFNKDIKETNVNEGTIKYYYAATNTWHTTYLDGLEILEFPNGQTEHRYPDGRVEVNFANNTVKLVNPNDEAKLEEWRFPDGTNVLQMRNGDRILMFANGQKEIHTKQDKRREYPDGTIKVVYPDGSQETRYSNGRIRLKDRTGKLIMDTEATA